MHILSTCSILKFPIQPEGGTIERRYFEQGGFSFSEKNWTGVNCLDYLCYLDGQ